MSIHDIINLTQTSDPCPWPSRIFVPPPGTDRIANPQASSIWNRTHTHGHPPYLGPEPHAPSPSALPGHRGRTHLSKHLGWTQTNPLALPGTSRRPNVSRQVLRRTAQAPRHRKDYAHASSLKTMTLTGVEFIRRFLFHLLPPGFTKIRHYGLFGNNRRQKQVLLARAALAHSPLRFEPKAASQPAASLTSPLLCPHCQGTALHCIGRVERSGKQTFFVGATLLLATLAHLYS